jgi:hypothetical protein
MFVSCAEAYPCEPGTQYLEGRYTLALPSASRLAISVAPSPAVKALRAWLDAAGIEAIRCSVRSTRPARVLPRGLLADRSLYATRAGFDGKMFSGPASLPLRLARARQSSR